MKKPQRTKAVFNWSGGKDSALALHKTLQSGRYEIVALLTTVNRTSRRSSMHAIPEALLRAQARSLGLPLHVVDLDPEGQMTGYEQAMEHTVRHFKAQGVTHFIFGDIFLHDVRSYRERQLAPYGIEVVEPLWDRTTDQIIAEFLASGLQTVVVTTTADILDERFVGRRLDAGFIRDLPPGADPCGENGEYHTFCYDGPIFSEPVAFRLGAPFRQSFPVRLDDGTEKNYAYWFAALDTPDAG
ncbi:MAG: adenine nucleotide alpha hydrolase [Rikenellaceae bacterium]|nr:adenine nucleotide alpha hydrolase [Rikenellaceae bacterium]